MDIYSLWKSKKQNRSLSLKVTPRKHSPKQMLNICLGKFLQPCWGAIQFSLPSTRPSGIRCLQLVREEEDSWCCETVQGNVLFPILDELNQTESNGWKIFVGRPFRESCKFENELIRCFGTVFGVPNRHFLIGFVVMSFSALTGFGMKSERSSFW